MSCSIQESEPDEGWNNLILKSKFATFHQTVEYAKYRKKWFGWIPKFLKFYDSKGELLALCLVFEYSRITQYIKNKKLGKVSSLLGKKFSKTKLIIRWEYGPVIIKNEKKELVYEELFKYLKKHDKKFYGFFHPLNQSSNFNEFSGGKDYGTFIIDLSQDLEKLWTNLRTDAKRKVSKAKTHELNFQQIKNKSDFKTYYSLYLETRKKSGVEEREFGDMFDLWNIKVVGQKGFIVFKNDIPLSGVLLATFGNYMIEYGPAKAINDSKLKVNASEFLKWKTFEWGKKNNLGYYDLAGVYPNSESKKEQGIYEFKKKWGGKYFDWTIYAH